MDSPERPSRRARGGPAEAANELGRWLIEKLLWGIQSLAFIAAGSVIFLVPMVWRFSRERVEVEELRRIETLHFDLTEALNRVNFDIASANQAWALGSPALAGERLDSASATLDATPLSACRSEVSEASLAGELTGDERRVVELLCGNRRLLDSATQQMRIIVGVPTLVESEMAALDAIDLEYDDSTVVVNDLMDRLREAQAN